MTGEIRKFLYNGEDVLSLPARREAFITLKEWLSTIADELDLPVKIKKQLLIVADEIFTNIANYGYPSGDGTAKVGVEFDMSRATISLEFTDSGIPYNPLDAPAPDLGKPLAERNIGGLGIFMVKKIMDTIEYRRENNTNILFMSKKMPTGQESSQK